MDFGFQLFVVLVQAVADEVFLPLFGAAVGGGGLVVGAAAQFGGCLVID